VVTEPGAPADEAAPPAEEFVAPVGESDTVVTDDLPAADDSEDEAVALRFTEPEELAAALEAILFVVEAPVTVAALAVAVQQTTETVQEALDRLASRYDERKAGIELRSIAGGVRIYTRSDYAEVVERFLMDGQRSRLTQAALETLAVIAYRQPVTRARVSAIRGVNVDGVVRTLIARGLIVEVGNDPETGGGQFSTTDAFLEKMGLNSLEDLPSLAPLLPDVEGLDSVGADDL